MNETSPPPERAAAAGGSAHGGPPRRLVAATAPVAKALAGRRWMPVWGVVRHRGRTSGTAYETPIAVVPTTSDTIVMIGLPWGAKTNWARNVMAAGSATLRFRGRDVALSRPRIVDGTEAQQLSKAAFRPVLKRFPAAIVLDRA
ncbi:nitroreductase family deazaflavin-dependent oxidoreductase [Agromyces sp. NPDC058110]|uniref:nitroreductase family deazaflavin-dependent oxidoreductase n=1 Tax=Agromyces sp. NPDC058110 TaxID=3346345 RepID=UPI0036D8B849